jgi:hypothetical protein
LLQVGAAAVPDVTTLHCAKTSSEDNKSSRTPIVNRNPSLLIKDCKDFTKNSGERTFSSLIF